MNRLYKFYVYGRAPRFARVGLLRVPLRFSNPLPAQYFAGKGSATSCPSHPSRLTQNLVSFIFYFFSFLYLYSQNDNSFFQLFKNQFYAYPFSGFGNRSLYNQKYSLEKIYFHTQIPFALVLNHNPKWNVWVTSINNLKMYNENNFPVKTPDYKISTHFAYQWNPTFQTIFSIQHHSNGQKDSLLINNNNINIETGNFSINAFQTFWIKKFLSKHLKFINLQSEHLIFYFSMGYMKKFYYHHAFHLQILSNTLIHSQILIYHHLNSGIFFQPQHKTRWKLEYITQFQYKNINFLPFIRIFYGPDEYNSRYLYQNFQITLGISSFLKPIIILPKNEN